MPDPDVDGARNGLISAVCDWLAASHDLLCRIETGEGNFAQAPPSESDMRPYDEAMDRAALELGRLLRARDRRLKAALAAEDLERTTNA